MQRKIWFACIAVLCGAGILLGVWAMLAGSLPRANDTPAPESTLYYLKDSGGRVAVYADSTAGQPLKVYDIYVNLLPESDALRLKNGFSVKGGAALERLLEDLGA